VDGEEEPPCEYDDGLLVQKSLGTRKHSQVQANIITLISSRYDTLNPLPELTARLRERKFYIPDISVEELAKPIQGRYPGPNNPVLLCVEVVSPPDRVGKLFAKCEEYHRWGVPYCWVIDPDHKVAWEYFPNDFEPRKVRDAITAGSIQLLLSDVFSRV
jgi:Uma2 family endonuclease